MDTNQPRGPTTSRLTFFDEVVVQTPGGDPRLSMCLQCGTCGGSCPSAGDMDHSPRELFAMIDAGLREEVLQSNTPWYCVSCYYCMVRCPQDIHITDLMYTLKRISLREGYYHASSASDAPGFSEMFINFVENYGRSYELGVASKYHLRYHPATAVKLAASMGLEMFRKQRMNLMPTRIRDLDKLQAILGKAHEMDAEVTP